MLFGLFDQSGNKVIKVEEFCNIIEKKVDLDYLLFVRSSYNASKENEKTTKEGATSSSNEESDLDNFQELEDVLN